MKSFVEMFRTLVLTVLLLSGMFFFLIIRIVTVIVALNMRISATFTVSANFYSMQSLETHCAFVVDTKWCHLAENVLRKMQPNKSFHDS